MNKRSTSAGRERDLRGSQDKDKLSSTSPNRNQLFSTSLSLLKNSPYSPEKSSKSNSNSNKEEYTSSSGGTTSLPAVPNARRSKSPSVKARPTSSGPLPDKVFHSRTPTLPPAVHSRPTTAHLPPAVPTSFLPSHTLHNGIPASKSLKPKVLGSKDKDRELYREREKDLEEINLDYQTEEVRKGLTVIKPHEQLQLTEEQLNEEVQIVLTANDPQVREGVVVFSLMEEMYKPSPSVDQSVCVFDLEGYHLHVETEEGKKQLSINQEEKRKQTMHSSTFTSAAHLYGSGDYDDESGPVLRNPFNFSDRAVQTISRPPRDRSTMTEPAARGTFSANVTQWAIYDAYEEERLSAQQGSGVVGSAVNNSTAANASSSVANASNGASVASAATGASSTGLLDTLKKTEELRNFIPVEFTSTKAQKADSAALGSDSFLAKLRVMERMVVQNASMGITMDFKYWDDPADHYQEEGTLLPLWKFSPEVAYGKTVTGICWNTRYPDLFAICHGSYDLVKMTTALLPLPDLPDQPNVNENNLPFSAGVICCYSLKNVAHPEYVFITESGVMCIDFHPQHPSLMAAGLYDGRVCVYSLTQPASKNPLFISSVRQKKHTEPVWKVRWQEDDLSKNLNFYSLSSDGRLTSWTLVKNEMLHNDILELKITRKPTLNTPNNSNAQAVVSTTSDPLPDDADYDTSLYGLAGGCCMDFLHGDHLFMVGTEEGALHKCSKAYSGRYLATYEGHTMAILSVEWNAFHPRVFMTCGADWSIKIWDHSRPAAIFALEFKIPVCDAKWAPFSSTIFAVATADGKISVYDLSRNKRDPLCCQLVTKSVPTHIAFNPIQPILLVADSLGRVHSLKLSPNLRHAPATEEEAAVGMAKSKSIGPGGHVGGANDLLFRSESKIASQDKGEEDGVRFGTKKNDTKQEEINKLELALMADLKKK